MDTNDFPFYDFLERSGCYREIPAHIARIASVLQRTVDGKDPRVLIVAPEDHGITKLLYHFMAFLREKHVMDAVDRWERGEPFRTKRPPIRFATHSQSTAEFLAGKACSIYPESEQRIMATSTESSVVGIGFDAAVVKSMYSGVKAAADAERRAQVNDWFTTSVMPRMVSPESPIIVADCRWHNDDLIGHILKNHAQENWHVVHLPVIRLEEVPECLLGNCTIEPDWREYGDILDPEKFEHCDLQLMCKRLSPEQWNARWMLNPGISITPRRDPVIGL